MAYKHRYAITFRHLIDSNDGEDDYLTEEDAHTPEGAKGAAWERFFSHREDYENWRVVSVVEVGVIETREVFVPHVKPVKKTKKAKSKSSKRGK